MPDAVEQIVVAAHGDETRGLSGLAVEVSMDAEILTFAPQRLDELPTAVLIELYRRSGAWRVRAVGQGWATGLGGLAQDYGVVVDAGDAQAPDPDSTSIRSESRPSSGNGTSW